MSFLTRLQIHPSRRFLQTENGAPFFWLGDTAWEIFHRLTLDETVHYLDNRRAKGFNVIQAVALAELEGLNDPNRNGHLPLRNMDVCQPVDEYFDHVVRVVDLAAERGLYIALLPTWGDKVNRMWGGGPEIFTPENAKIYGRYLGMRMRGKTNLVWVLGGDRGASGVEDIWREMAAGLDEGMGERLIKTYHPYGEHSSAEWLHTASWLDFNMMQSGHGQICYPVWETIENDLHREPAKPVLDGEPNYEDLPIGFTSQNGYFNEAHVRRQVYRSVFAGGCGVTYGHNSVWQIATTGRNGVIEPLLDWRAALDRPGAAQMCHLKHLVESRPFFERVPGQELIRSGAGKGAVHIRAARSQEYRYALVYIPQGGIPFELDLTSFVDFGYRAWWFNPRNGQAEPAQAPGTAFWTVTAPVDGPDWVLVIDSAKASFGPPGGI